VHRRRGRRIYLQLSEHAIREFLFALEVHERSSRVCAVGLIRPSEVDRITSLAREEQ